MSLGFGGNPYGPAGTGKTESVKALGAAFGRQVLVFNCDEGIDVKSMGRIFIGLVKCGAWGCFDEFNRLEADVLSAVSMQIQKIQHAIREREPESELLGRTISVDPNSAIYITMNPAGKGYGGRQKLPDNLKQLFRPVAMTKADLEMIAEVELYAEGFKQAKLIGRKIVTVFKLAGELLSKQQHYDWKLRALKPIFRAAGAALSKAKLAGRAVDAAAETEIIVQVARTNTLSKLTLADVSRFNQLCQDLFPGVKQTEAEHPALVAAIHEAYAEMKLVPMESQVKKMLEFYDQLRQRCGVVLVGPSGSGKTTTWRVLHAALSKIQRPLKRYVVNPKAMPREQLLGHIDMDTREWFDGVITNSARLVVKEPLEVNSWIVCDGDIDPEWIESLNSVLDDNRLLTMPNGERIQVGPNVNMVFETHDLSSASPATISRMGMIFLSEDDMDEAGLVEAWLLGCDEEGRAALHEWIGEFLWKAIGWVREHVAPSEVVVKQSKLGLTFNALAQVRTASSKLEFVCGLIRGLGGPLTLAARAELAHELFQWARESPPDPKRVLDCYCDAGGNLAVYGGDVADELSLAQLDGEPLIMTREAQRTMDTLRPLFASREPFVLVGPEGCGKLNLLQHAFTTLRSTAVAVINCNAQTSPDDVKDKLTQMCLAMNTNTGRVFRPKDSECLILYLKDLNLPKLDKYGTSALVSFLQQAINYKGFYDDSLEWIGLENVQIISSMNPSTTLGRSELTTRFTSVVRVLYVDHTDREQLQGVYNAYLSPILSERAGGDPQWASPKNVMRLAGSMLAVYDGMRERFSRDDHSHYLFSPKNLTEWVLGLLRYDLAAEPLLDCWAHEARRIFQDKMVGPDSAKFDALLRNILRSDWEFTEHAAAEPKHYITFNPAAPPADAAALRLHGKPLFGTDDATVLEIIENARKMYAREVCELDLLMFGQMVDRLAAIDRALSKPGGSLLLAGRSGTGRRALVSLCAYMLRLELMTLKLSRGYGVKNFRLDLKAAMTKAGAEDEPLLLVLEDHHFVDGTFIEMVNSLLATGDVPGLFKPNELDPLLAPIKEAASDQGWRGTLYSFFTERVRQNLRIVLIMDCSSPTFTLTCESNPALYSKCALVWMEAWSAASMQSVASMLLGAPIFEQLGDPAAAAAISKNLCFIHDSAVELGATPKHFTEACKTYAQLYTQKRSVKQHQRESLKKGLAKLSDASALVDELTASAHKQSLLCGRKQIEADQALEDITKSMEMASKQRAAVEQLQGSLGAEEAKLSHRKKAIDIELASVGPLLAETKKAVGSIQPKSLNEIRALRAPPPAVRDILQGVLILMGIFDTSWVSMRSFLAKRTVKDEIIHFDARKISPEIREQVEAFIAENSKSFEPAAAKRASVACAPLAMWVKANLQYADVLDKIQPLESQAKLLEDGLADSQDKLKELNDELGALDAKVADLRLSFEKSTHEGAKLKMELEVAQGTIVTAEALLGKLVGENDRWTEQVAVLDTEIALFTNHALVAAAFVTYLPQVSEGGRKAMVARWAAALDVDAAFSFRSFMASESEELQWRSEGLPSDSLSVENAVIIQSSSLSSYLIDPNSTGSDWLKTMLKGSRLEVVNQQDANFMTALELAVRFGKTLLVQEADVIDPVLYPLLRRELVVQGPQATVQIGEKMVIFDDDFKLFLSTRSPKPDIAADAKAILTEVNFTITRAGLSGQLLAATIKHEKPELEEQKTTLLREEELLKGQLRELEDDLLRELSEATGNILENKSLLDSLTKTKTKAATIALKLDESIKIAASLNGDRDAYLPLAQSAAQIFFVLMDLTKVNNMYQVSLAAFLQLFHIALETPDGGHEPGLRIKLLQSNLLTLTYRYVCRSLFKADRLMFAMHMAHGMRPELFEPKEWGLFCGTLVDGSEKLGSRRKESVTQITTSAPGWVAPERALALDRLLTAMPGLAQAFQIRDGSLWADWARSPKCEAAFPKEILRKVTRFQEVLLVQCVRPDRLQSAMALFAGKVLGMHDVYAADTGLKTMLAEMTPKEPLLIIVSEGVDPSADLAELAAGTVGSARFHEVAMGQGQAELALAKMNECAASGDWLCLKNLHLVTSWLPTLEKVMNGLAPHQDFRLWLTSEAHPNFSPMLLQRALKITYEAPPGLKKNLARTYEGWSDAFIREGSSNRAQALFVLAYMHAIMQERRVYVPQGWSKFYEFSSADLRTAVAIISRVCAEASGSGRPIAWEDIHGLLSLAVYGGRWPAHARCGPFGWLTGSLSCCAFVACCTLAVPSVPPVHSTLVCPLSHSTLVCPASPCSQRPPPLSLRATLASRVQHALFFCSFLFLQCERCTAAADPLGGCADCFYHYFLNDCAVTYGCDVRL
jgi:dynein heavy chain 2